MRAVLVNAPETQIEAMREERQRLGIDTLDECWNGEWHFVNPPKYWHIRLTTDLLRILDPLALSSGLVPSGDGCGVFSAPDDFRVPDLTFARPEHITDDGITSAELVIEIRSPGDDSYDKLPFYASRGIGEVLIVHRDRTFELRRLVDNTYEVVAEADGGVHVASLDVVMRTISGPALQIGWYSGTAEV